MARLNPFVTRRTGQYAGYLGRIILFCEGLTEENYFRYFADIIEKNQIKYSHIEIIPVNAGGNAQRVFNFAKDFFNCDENIRKYSRYEKYLIFDCDAPDEIQQVINEMDQPDINFIITPTNIVFETWLLMHFEVIEAALSKSKTYQRMADVLGVIKYGNRQKNSKGLIRKAIGNGDNVRSAIENARKLENEYKMRNLTVQQNIIEMNPYTAVHRLMESILSEMENS